MSGAPKLLNFSARFRAVKSKPECTGFLCIDKPQGMTSHDVVAKLRRLLKIKQIGHAGTLDPLATGVMAIAVGQATRLLRFLDDDKSYDAEILFGRQTDTDDIEGAVKQEWPDFKMPPREKVEAALKQFQGKILQVPPIYSALHVDGKRLYELARKGEIDQSQIQARTVVVHSIALTAYNPPYISLSIDCGKGTYIRSIARDLGRCFDSGACLAALRRTASGRFAIEKALSLPDLEEQLKEGPAPLLAIAEILPLPQVNVDKEQTRRLKLGQSVLSGQAITAPYVLVLDQDSVVCVAVARDGENGAACYLKPEVVLRSGE